MYSLADVEAVAISVNPDEDEHCTVLIILVRLTQRRCFYSIAEQGRPIIGVYKKVANP